jgi:hypothetical protein
LLLETNNESNSSQVLESNNHTTVNSSSSSTTNNNLMDIDDDLYENSSTNGFSKHGTVSSTTNQISNGHSLLDDDNNNNLVIDKKSNSNRSSRKTTENLDGMEDDGYGDSTHTMDIEPTLSSDVEKKSTLNEDDQLLIRILHFGRELHLLKQQLSTEYGENIQHDKMLQVYLIKEYFYTDLKDVEQTGSEHFELDGRDRRVQLFRTWTRLIKLFRTFYSFKNLFILSNFFSNLKLSVGLKIQDAFIRLLI